MIMMGMQKTPRFSPPLSPDKEAYETGRSTARAAKPLS